MRHSNERSRHNATRHSRRHKRMNLEQQLEGMVMLEIPTTTPQQILSLLSGNGIVLYHVETTADALYITIVLDDFKRTNKLLRHHHLRFRIGAKHGMPFFLSRCKRRKGVWLGLVCAILLGQFLLSFLWTYEVTGNERYSDAHIIALVQQYGLWPGTKLHTVEYAALEHTIELEHPEFTWVQLERKGTTLCIAVKERLADSADLQYAGSIVAKADGKITALTVYTGTDLVAMGQSVQAGQVLIGGWDYPERVRNTMGLFVDAGAPYAVQAQGEVRGEVLHRAVGTCALEETWLVPTGNCTKGTMVLWGQYQLFTLGEEVSPYVYSDTVVTRKSILGWGKWQCPIVLCTTTYQEQREVRHRFTPEEAYHTAIERARRRLELSMPQDGIFVRESYGMHRNMQEGIIQAEVVWTIDEPLGQMAQVPLPDVAK